MALRSCIPVIPSMDLEKTLRFWRDGLGFEVRPFSHKEGRLTGCMLSNGHLMFMLNIRAGTPDRPSDYESIRLYWAPDDLTAVWAKLKSLGFPVSEITQRDYGQTEFFLVDEDGYDHCFGVSTST